MNPIELLKSGIERGEWGSICQAYTTLTGQTITPPPENAGLIYKQFYQNVSALLDRGVENQVNIPEVTSGQGVAKQGKKRGRPKKEKFDEPDEVGIPLIVGIPKTMTFITGSPYDAKEADKWAAVAKKSKIDMPSRKPYKPVYLSCPKCNNSVDITKSHVHVGTIMADGERKRDESKIQCPKCHTKFMVTDGNKISMTPFPKE